MSQYLYQVAYTSESLAAQIKNPQDRLEVVGKQINDAVGARILAGGYSYGEYDVSVIVDASDDVYDGRGRPRDCCRRGGPSRQDHAAAERRSVGGGPEEGAGGQRPVPPRPVGTAAPRRPATNPSRGLPSPGSAACLADGPSSARPRG